MASSTSPRASAAGVAHSHGRVDSPTPALLLSATWSALRFNFRAIATPAYSSLGSATRACLASRTSSALRAETCEQPEYCDRTSPPTAHGSTPPEQDHEPAQYATPHGSAERVHDQIRTSCHSKNLRAIDDLYDNTENRKNVTSGPAHGEKRGLNAHR
jgi:hypothetical protein